MSEDITITIGFKVLTDELERAANILDRMATSFSQLQAGATGITPTMHGVSTAVGSIAGQVRGVIPSIEQLVDWFGITEEQARTAQEILKEAVVIPRETPAFYRQMVLLGEALGLTTEDAERFTRSLMSSGRAVRALDVEYAKFRDTIKAQRIAMGAQLYELSRVTYQIYWLGIGIMFVSMSFARLLQRQQTVQNQTFSLAKAYQSVSEAQKALNEAIIESGAGSEAAMNAAGRLKEAEYALQLQISQTKESLIMERLAWVQLIFGMMPVFINAFMLGIQLYSFIAAKRVLNIGLMSAESASLGKLAIEQNVATGAAIRHGAAQQYLTGTLWGTAIAGSVTQAVLWGLATAGIGAAISLGLSYWAMSTAEAQMKDLEEEARELANEFTGATSATDRFSLSLGPHSVAGSARHATRELNNMYNVLVKLSKISPMLEVDTSEIDNVRNILSSLKRTDVLVNVVSTGDLGRINNVLSQSYRIDTLVNVDDRELNAVYNMISKPYRVEVSVGTPRELDNVLSTLDKVSKTRVSVDVKVPEIPLIKAKVEVPRIEPVAISIQAPEISPIIATVRVPEVRVPEIRPIPVNVVTPRIAPLQVNVSMPEINPIPVEMSVPKIEPVPVNVMTPEIPPVLVNFIVPKIPPIPVDTNLPKSIPVSMDIPRSIAVDLNIHRFITGITPQPSNYIITVNVNNPVVREEEDIDKISKSIQERLVDLSKFTGVRYGV